MDLINLKTLSTNDKLAVIHTTAGLQWLGERLLDGKSLRQIAHLLSIDPKTIYKWRNYTAIAEVIDKVRLSKVVTANSMICEPRGAAYRVILAYDNSSFIRNLSLFKGGIRASNVGNIRRNETMLSPSITQKFKIDTLIAIDCKMWCKNGMSRIYINEAELQQLLGTEVGYYSTNSLKNCKYYYDITSDSYGYKHYPGCIDQHESIFRQIDEFLSAKYNAHQVAKAEREVTLDELNAALGL